MTVAVLSPPDAPELSALLEGPVRRLADAELAESLRHLGRLSSRVEARRAELIAEAERRGVARRQGFGSTTAWLMALSGDPAAVCRSRLAVAVSLQEMPETRAAFTAGEIPESRVRLLAEAHALAPEQFTRDEARLLAQAAAAPPQSLPRVLADWRRTDPQGAEADSARVFSQRALHLSPSWSGLVHLDGDLDPEGGSVVLAALRSLSEAAALDPRDSRTPPQCRADALVEICRRHLDGGQTRGTGRPHLSVTVPWQALKEGTGVVDLEGGPINVAAVARLARDATVTTVAVDGHARPVAAAPARRVVSPALRRALDHRDRHCTHPGCGVPARWCDAHHIQHWVDGGKTEAANLRLLCRRHHRAAHEHRPYPPRE